ncbi:hypothetical protein Pint_11506 [Pistacia integerrima]|uniref:Uncharacterized protein n=1 Tax=Pistacia integerrima TaxID=434235 RepID=A0ACC0XJV1_9ROSI|nr:hypothetical protein Pint_11506 [Pistacia integerrima]
MLRPPMSRVVNMLAGDREVGPVTSKPSYLTDWDFKDTTNSFMKGDIVQPHRKEVTVKRIANTTMQLIFALKL